MNKIMAISLITLMMAGCAAQRAGVASRAQTEMIGMSKKDLLACAGVPARRDQVDGTEYFTYIGGGDSVGTGVATATSPNTAVAVTKQNRRYCEATFVIQDGVVSKVNYAGRTGGLLTKGEQCSFIVENCIPSIQ